MWRVVLVALAIFAGIWFGKPQGVVKTPIAFAKNIEKEFPVTEHKSFVVVLYAYNQAAWCEKALRSIFEQDYDHYRVVIIDDGSSDGTAELAKQFILENNQAEKVILIRNETKLGQPASLYRAIDNCLDREIVIAMDAKDWFLSPAVFARLNRAYQNPDVWLSMGESLDYPSYETKANGPVSYYAALFKQISLSDLLEEGHFASHADAYLKPLLGLSSGRICKLQEPLLFSNSAASTCQPLLPTETAEYKPLSHFPKPKAKEAADLLVFSTDRPLQLYACLESVQRYISGIEQLTVLYQATNPNFAAGYEKVKQDFPAIRFVLQQDDFKSKTQELVFSSPSRYVLFGSDQIIVKDFVDLRSCTDLMEKTAAYGFYLRLGSHIHSQELPPREELAAGVFAWNLATGESDWSLANSLDMTIFRKEQLKEPLAKLKYKTAANLEAALTELNAPKKAVGLYFERSKLVSIEQKNALTAAELLVKFNQGLKIDIEPLYKVENRTPQVDYIPELIPR